MTESSCRKREVLDWQKAAAQKREATNKSIPSQWGLLSSVPTPEEQRDVTGRFMHQYLSEQEIVYTGTDAVNILKHIHAGQWKAHDVLAAFCHRAAIAHQVTNCLHEIMFESALADALELDEYYERTGNIIGPLHGLPISLKDQFHVEGVDTTMGYVGWIGKYQVTRDERCQSKTRESELVRELRGLGALLFCKTSVPHTLMAGETVNNIVGYTWNPNNRHLSAGGSSGGEGALMACHGSPLGLGTDIGGSIRIPAAFNGLYGLKPSAGRLPYEGMVTSMDGQTSLLSVVGPISTSADSLKLLVEAVLQAKPWLYDPLVVNMPWRESVYQQYHKPDKQLTFGVLWNDYEATPHPPVTRALQKVVATIKMLGHRVIEWQPPSHKRGIDLVYKIWTFDGGHDVHGAFALSGEPPAEQIVKNYGVKPSTQARASEIAATNVAKREFQKDYMDYWNSTKCLTDIDEPAVAFISPLAPFAAARPGKYEYHGYSMLANILDYSATVFPVTTCDRDIDKMNESYTSFNEMDQRVWNTYDPDVYHGTPVAVQLTCRRFEEEKVVALTEMISQALSQHLDTS